MREAPRQVNKRFHRRALAAGVAGLFAIALIAPASSAAAPGGALKPNAHGVKCGTVDVLAPNPAVCNRDTAITFTNTASVSVNVSSATITGANPGDFQLDTPGADDCLRVPNLAIAPGGTCTLLVLFDPQQTGRRLAVLQVTDSVTGTFIPVKLSGRGV